METACVHTLKTNANMVSSGLGTPSLGLGAAILVKGMEGLGGGKLVSEHKTKNTKPNHISIEQNKWFHPLI